MRTFFQRQQYSNGCVTHFYSFFDQLALKLHLSFEYHKYCLCNHVFALNTTETHISSEIFLSMGWFHISKIFFFTVPRDTSTRGLQFKIKKQSWKMLEKSTTHFILCADFHKDSSWFTSLLLQICRRPFKGILSKLLLQSMFLFRWSLITYAP